MRRHAGLQQPHDVRLRPSLYREGRRRFQDLEDPAFGFERFTAKPTVDGVPVSVDYPGAPDSTVASPDPSKPGFRPPHVPDGADVMP